MLGFTFLKDYSGSYLENGLEGAEMETTIAGSQTRDFYGLDHSGLRKMYVLVEKHSRGNIGKLG